MTNSGDVSTTGSTAPGITANGNVTNSGNVSTTGSRAAGITASGNVTNSGDVSTSGNAAAGIRGVNVTNSGDVSTTGSTANGITATGNATNSGDVSTTGDGAYAIFATGNVSNSGDIQVSGSSAEGIISNGSGGNNIVVSGSIIATGGATTAINAGSGNDTVTLNSNARIQGIVKGGSDSDTLNLNQTVSECNASALNASATTQTGAAGGLTVNGGAFTWTNFEALVAAMTNANSCNATSGGASSGIATPSTSNRINGQDVAAPIALFCVSPGNIAAYRVVGNAGVPLFAYSREGNQVAFIGDNFGATVTAQGDGSVLVTMPQANGKLYSTTIAATMCV